MIANNKEYQVARKNGFNGSFAQFAETINRQNSELLSPTVSARKYFNELGGGDDFYIDVTKNIKQMAEVTDNTIYGNLSEMMKTQANFALGGAVLGFMYSVVRRINWIPATIGGMLLGALAGWTVANLKQKEETI